ncbi:TetR/AcrR family transcriptional regulator [Streptomyces sp. H27-D2]|uniref:TetR/AcrR family transcriptional regulator n=1 Tax=Streptomyces sp. H27-D2 TaxID=3046304 RepID=UPI002DBC84AC|nr:TetR/AcrR family transcriptional regulator [Streptomyces sp. H27-D2]MEC4019705.1 TetR/AcrR family transcriptional regulator [Streptomyces sp. H27-D2]
MTGSAGRVPRRSPVKRRSILDAAIEVFSSQGYARTSVDAIAAAAGVGKQTVYGHFGDKERLFLAAVDEARAASSGDPDNLASFDGSPLADLTAIGERLLDVVLSPRVAALHRLTVAEISHHPQLQRTWKGSAAPALDGHIAAYFRTCDLDGTLVVPDPARTARQFAYLLVTEGRVETGYGTLPLSPDRRRAIAGDCADLIVRAHRP